MKSLLRYTLKGIINISYEDVYTIYSLKDLESLPSDTDIIPVGYRSGLKYEEDKTGIGLILTGFDKIIIKNTYISIDSGVRYIEYLTRLLNNRMYIHFSYPPNPFESIGGLFNTNLLIPAYSLTYDEVVRRIIYYDLNSRSLLGREDGYIEYLYTSGSLKDVILLRLHLRKIPMHKGFKPQVLYGVCESAFLSRLVSNIDSRIDISIIKGGREFEVVSYTYTSEGFNLVRSYLEDFKCDVKRVNIKTLLEVFPNIYKYNDYIKGEVRRVRRDDIDKILDKLIYIHLPSMQTLIGVSDE
ncbi:hypothetical protein DRN84_03465 [Candidatus Geothermarchaeota archaeon]|mgnify:CR=1 FL=1|nr:MAG: hypothetical protein DRN87_03830 [Candidatus Geothermarchaeota archaeon]RLG61489.1 MAG: hypothetical protein DRN84_03465 [Candidatus Geothermarchaeota archaeon]HEW94297.1 hypothetical protein [Thermoprotei archaeon]